MLSIEEYHNIILKILNGLTGKQIASEYHKTESYISNIKKTIMRMKYPPKIIDGKLVCYKCELPSNHKLIFHHIHSTGEVIALVCNSCNFYLKQGELSPENGISTEYRKLKDETFDIMVILFNANKDNLKFDILNDKQKVKIHEFFAKSRKAIYRS